MIMKITKVILFVRILIVAIKTRHCFIQNITDTSDITDVGYSMCPYTSFCRSENKSVPEGYYSCCEECSCSDDCHLANQCCPDAEIRNTNTDLTCKYQFEYFDEHRNVYTRPRFTTYYIVDTCLQGQNEDVNNRCLQPTALEDHVLVSDRRSLRIYKNKHCAQCNGVQQYETWELVVQCPYDEALFAHERRDEFVLQHCGLVSQPPEHMKYFFDRMRCEPWAISSCNLTGLWDVYDVNLIRGCDLYNMVYKDETISPTNVLKGYRLYKNVYCFLCNNARGTISKPLCVEDYNSDKGEPLRYSQFTSILNLSSTKHTTNQTCKTNEMMDPYMGSCVRFFCPFGETPVHGSCIQTMHEIHVSLYAIYTIDIRSSKNGLQNSINKLNIFSIFNKHIQTKFTSVGCKLCDIKESTGQIFFVSGQPSKRCPLPKILEIFQYISKLSVSSQKLNMTIHLNQTNNYAIEYNRRNKGAYIPGLEIVKEYKNHTCKPGVRLNTKSFCKGLIFNALDLINKEVPTKILSKLLTVSDPYYKADAVRNTFMICLDDYKRITNAASNWYCLDATVFAVLALSLTGFQTFRIF